MSPIKTYFLVPGWDFPTSSVSLGSIITNPAQPQLALFKAAPEDLGSPVHVSERAEFAGPIDVGRDGGAGLFSTFLGLFGLGDEDGFQYDRKSVLSYSFRQLRVHGFTPSEALKRRAVAETDRVAQFCRASEFKASVFMITEIKTIRGAGVTTASSRGKGWRVSLGVGTASPTGNDAEAGTGEDAEPLPIVFAFQLAELRLSASGEVSAVGFTEGIPSGELQDRLDSEYGEGTFTAVEGFDEEDGSSCRIIASSPTCVDLLTAGSAKIDLSRSRSQQRS